MTVVHLALAVPPESTYRIEQLTELLTTDQRTRAERFRHGNDRVEYVTAHALTRLARDVGFVGLRTEADEKASNLLQLALAA